MTKTDFLRVRFPPSQLAAVKAIADADGCTVSEWIRRVVERRVNEPKMTVDPRLSELQQAARLMGHRLDWRFAGIPPDDLDPGIARAVYVLNAAGIATFESCEGGEGHAVPMPIVRFHGSPATGWAALAACVDHGLPVDVLARAWDIDDGEPSGPYWSITFRRKLDPIDTEATE